MKRHLDRNSDILDEADHQVVVFSTPSSDNGSSDNDCKDDSKDLISADLQQP